MPVHIRPRTNVVPPLRTVWPCSTLFVYAMTSPRMASSAAYAASCRSKARQAAPMERAAQSVIRAGSARITPMTGLRRRAGSRIDPSVRLVEVAALEQVEVAVIVLDAEVHLQVILHDLRRGVALRPGIVGERQDHEARVLARDRLQPARIRRGLRRVLRYEGHEPGVERQAALAVAQPELGRPRLAGDDDGQVHEVV